jgi:nicotinamide-nucleotide amidase
MAEGALKNSTAQLSIAVTGIAGPGGGTAIKQVGLVYIAVGMLAHETTTAEYNFSGDRSAIRLAALETAIEMAMNTATAMNRPPAE